MSWPESQYIIDEATKVSGIPPQNISEFSVETGKSEDGLNRATISCKAPSNTVIDNFLLCTVGGVRIIRKENEIPSNPEDGMIIANAVPGEDFEYIDLGLKNDVEYYYSFFPYSDHGVYNYNAKNFKKVMFTDTGEEPEPEPDPEPEPEPVNKTFTISGTAACQTYSQYGSGSEMYSASPKVTVKLSCTVKITDDKPAVTSKSFSGTIDSSSAGTGNISMAVSENVITLSSSLSIPRVNHASYLYSTGSGAFSCRISFADGNIKILSQSLTCTSSLTNAFPYPNQPPNWINTGSHVNTGKGTIYLNVS